MTYIIDVRGGGPSAGYISAGVSGGMQLFINPVHLADTKVFLYRVCTRSVCPYQSQSKSKYTLLTPRPFRLIDTSIFRSANGIRLSCTLCAASCETIFTPNLACFDSTLCQARNHRLARPFARGQRGCRMFRWILPRSYVPYRRKSSSSCPSSIPAHGLPWLDCRVWADRECIAAVFDWCDRQQNRPGGDATDVGLFEFLLFQQPRSLIFKWLLLPFRLMGLTILMALVWTIVPNTPYIA